MRQGERAVLAAGFVLALLLRLFFFRAFAENYDTQSYREVVRVMVWGGDPYGGTDRYNYSPVWAGTLAVLDVAARASGLPLSTAVGALLLAADVLAALLLFRLGGGGEAGLRAALLFFANPVSVWLSSYHRSFDAIAILLLLLALRLFRADPVRPARVSAALAASLLFKHVAAFHPLLFLRGRRRPGLGLIGLAAPYAVFLASFVPFWRSWRPIRDNVLLYGGLGGLYGTDALLLVPGVPFWVPRLLFAAAMLTAVVLLRRAEIEPVRASLILFLVVLIFLPGIGRQYFVWPIALGALCGGPGYLVYSVIATGSLVSVSGLAPGLPHLPGWYGVWWACVLWLLLELRALGGVARRLA
jgi:hypothetical protein